MADQHPAFEAAVAAGQELVRMRHEAEKAKGPKFGEPAASISPEVRLKNLVDKLGSRKLAQEEFLKTLRRQ